MRREGDPVESLRKSFAYFECFFNSLEAQIGAVRQAGACTARPSLL